MSKYANTPDLYKTDTELAEIQSNWKVLKE